MYVNYNVLIPDHNPFLTYLDFIFSGASWRHAAAPWPILKFTIANTLSGGGGELRSEKVGDTRRNIWIKPLKETNQGVAPALFDP